MMLRTYGLWGMKTVSVTLPDDGTLTPEARWVFTNGHCHSFALAMQRLTGWKLVAARKGDGGGGVIEHVLVANTNRSPLVVADAEMSLVLPDRDPDVRVFRCKFPRKGWLKAEVDKALPFARRRLEEMRNESGNAHYETRMPEELKGCRRVAVAQKSNERRTGRNRANEETAVQNSGQRKTKY